MTKKMYYLLILITSYITISCSENETMITKTDEFPEIIELVTNVETKYRGTLTPYAIKVKNDIASISFVESTINSTIHITDEKSKLCVELFREAIQKCNPLKIFTIANSREIAQVNQSLKENANYVEIASRNNLREYDSTIPDPDKIVQIPNLEEFTYNLELLRGTINWEYSGEGCYARAHRVYDQITSMGYTCYKFFLFGDGTPIYGYNRFFDCYSEWGWHVGALVFYNGDGYVIDFTLADDALESRFWADLVGMASGYTPRYVITPGDVYLFNPHSGQVVKDINSTYSRCVLDYFENHKGCNGELHFCPPYFQ